MKLVIPFFIMGSVFYTYILYSPSSQRIYIGYTTSIENRLLSHNHPGNKGWTKRYAPWTVIHYETFTKKQEAMAREKWFKSGIGREYIKGIILSKNR
jgi:putative endonuclease